MEDLNHLLKIIYDQFGLILTPKPGQAKFSGCHDKVMECAIAGSEISPDNPAWRQIRLMCEEAGWVFSRQGGAQMNGGDFLKEMEEMTKAGKFRLPQHSPTRTHAVFMSPIEILPISIAYHATRLAWVPSILGTGLRPRSDEFRTSDRLDCDGNIYIVEELGEPADAETEFGGSAHWWRGRFSRQYGQAVPLAEWAIVQVSLEGMNDLRIVRDIWSASGRVLLGVDLVPPERIALVFSS